jgi:hypothetical protein
MLRVKVIATKTCGCRLLEESKGYVSYGPKWCFCAKHHEYSAILESLRIDDVAYRHVPTMKTTQVWDWKRVNAEYS